MFQPLYYRGNLPVFNVFFPHSIPGKCYCPDFTDEKWKHRKVRQLTEDCKVKSAMEKKNHSPVLNHKLALQVSIIFLLYDPDQLCLEFESMQNLTDHSPPT